ncbi:transcription factor HES-1-like [Montipora capricornis]|uniref:transcription factor HES-1-like n=1 Tax=Montipora capricornis TaxID=246305 RepID=UPI0035F12A18
MTTANYCKQQSDYVSKILTEKRKAKKPLMEKMRRARINDSLNELKSLILEALNKDASRYSKMEKADVLEMTVQYLKELKRREHILQDPNSYSLTECRASFVQCASDITRKMTSSESTDKLRASSLAQLAFRCQGNTTNTAVRPLSLYKRDTLQYTRSLPPVIILSPYPRTLTRDTKSVSPNSTGMTQNAAMTLPRGQKVQASSESPPVWRPW